ncbi:uncharacterized protein LOC127795666 [Diospyros lotus]|uniref:uncharacterized protein LOC127795666 n=1 Tax=Diospyros lotus TaxID=55363 RepID=UPI00225A760B|nr:uncharacterized protein LOC127795666 [Diospyros lotus]
MCATLDGDGRNLLHLATMEGDVCVLTMFLEDKTYWNHELLKAKDSGGNTIFHLAVKHKKFEAMQFLVKKVEAELKGKNIQKPANPLNECGYTTLDILEEIKADVPEFDNVKEMFRKPNALKASEVNQVEWLSKKRDAPMVVASLIATMAFQAGVSPPGVFWQENSADHRAGEAVMAFNYPDSYPLFLRANTIGFVASVSTILFLVTGWPFKKFLMWILVLIMWILVQCDGTSFSSSHHSLVESVVEDQPANRCMDRDEEVPNRCMDRDE